MRVPTFVRSHVFGPSPSGSPRRLGRAWRLAIAGATGVATIVGSAMLAQPAYAAAATLYVATTGSDTTNCQTAGTPCATLAYALTEAGLGTGPDTIMIAPGTYTMAAGTSNTVPSGTAFNGLTIESNGGTAANTIINAAGAINGVAVNANNVTINGITVENAGAAGIMVSPPSGATPPATVSGETISNDVVTNSDQCQATPAATGCAAAIGAGDYGESIWLMSVTSSTLEGTTIENGLDGGLLVSDELGPNHNNTIEDNQVLNNALGCGITLAAHNMAAIFSSGPDAGQPDPAAGGVYSNTIEDNTSDGAGANGIGLFNAAYNNTIEGNTTVGNGGPGIEIDDDIPGADLNGNSIIGNTVGQNSLLGGPGGDSPGQHTVHTTQTGGVLVIARVTPVTGTLIEDNTITGNYYGIWMSAQASTTTLSANVITVTKGGLAVFVSPAPGSGYWELGSDGGVFSFGQAPYEGSTGGIKLNQPVVAMAATPDGGGYWLVAKDGGIFSFGDANYYGSLPGLKVSVSNIVGMVPTPDGGGYWLVGKDGGIFNFGDAGYFGSLPGLKVSVSNVVGIAGTSDNGGYWLVGKDGGIFNFGDAGYFGSLPGLKVTVSNVGAVAATPDGKGYWMVGSDGGVFSFGDATYFGSLPGLKIKVSNVLGVVTTP